MARYIKKGVEIVASPDWRKFSIRATEKLVLQGRNREITSLFILRATNGLGKQQRPLFINWNYSSSLPSSPQIFKNTEAKFMASEGDKRIGLLEFYKGRSRFQKGFVKLNSRDFQMRCVRPLSALSESSQLPLQGVRGRKPPL